MISSVITFTSGVIVGAALSGGAAAYCWSKRRRKQPTDSEKKAMPEVMVGDILKAASPTAPAPQTSSGNAIPPLKRPDFGEREAEIIELDTPTLRASQAHTETAPELPVKNKAPLTDATPLSPAIEQIEEAADDSPTEEAEQPMVFATGKFRNIANTATEENLKMLLLDRLDEIDEEAPELTRQALCAVTLLDEIREMKGAYTGQNAAVLSEIARGVNQHLIELECEVLDSDSWDASIQKIGKVTYDLPPGTEPVITAKLSSGLKIAGRLIRKQSVALSKSEAEL